MITFFHESTKEQKHEPRKEYAPEYYFWLRLIRIMVLTRQADIE